MKRYKFLKKYVSLKKCKILIFLLIFLTSCMSPSPAQRALETTPILSFTPIPDTPIPIPSQTLTPSPSPQPTNSAVPSKTSSSTETQEIIPTPSQTSTPSVPEIKHELVGQVGGTLHGLAVQDGYIYLGKGPRMAVYSINSSDDPQFISQTSILSGVVSDLLVMDNFAYLVTESDLVVVDIAKPNQLQVIGQSPSFTPSRYNRLVVDGSMAYVLGSHLQLVDLQDPAHPRLAGSLVLPEGRGDIQKVGDFVYIVRGKLLGVDVSDPENPREAFSTFEGDDVRAMTKAGAYLFVSSIPGTKVLDISNPGNPQVLNTIEFEGLDMGTVVIAASQNYLYTGASFCDGGGCESELRVYNLQDIGAIRMVNRVDGWFRGSLSVFEDHLYMLDEYGQLEVYDLRTPENPQLTGVLNTIGEVSEIFHTGSFITIVRGMQVIDLTNPEDPIRVKSAGLCSEKLVLSGRYGFCPIGFEGFSIIDLHDPVHPREIAEWSEMYECDNLAYVNGFIYACAGRWIIDVRDPDHPKTFSTGKGLGDWFSDMDGIGSVGYINLPSEPGLFLYDLADPLNPDYLGKIFDNTDVYSLRVIGEQAYVVTPQDFIVLDVSDPKNPVIRGEVSVKANNFAVTDTRLYVLGENRLHIIDIADLDAPVELGFFDTPGLSIEASGEYVYIAAGDMGLLVYKILE